MYEKYDAMSYLYMVRTDTVLVYTVYSLMLVCAVACTLVSTVRCQCRVVPCSCRPILHVALISMVHRLKCLTFYFSAKY